MFFHNIVNLISEINDFISEDEKKVNELIYLMSECKIDEDKDENTTGLTEVIV
jgi:hypothetical protein